MASALQVEKTGRVRGVIVNESAEKTKARIELARQEEGKKVSVDGQGYKGIQGYIQQDHTQELVSIATFYAPNRSNY